MQLSAHRDAPVCIVGAGFSGTMVAANLARRGVRSVLVECAGRAGRGAAYSTGDPAHLLNIPAESMAAWPDAPDDFMGQERIEPGSYAERRRFGDYLRSILEAAVASGHVELVEDQAITADAVSGGWRVGLKRGTTLDAGALVLALGNQQPAPLAGEESAGSRLIANPWGETARAAIADCAERQLDVFILGTSLTMIDVALSLSSVGNSRIVALSRRGKIPLSNGSDLPSQVAWEQLPAPRVRAIARWLRNRSAQVGWRPAVDSLRPHSHRLWQALPASEKRLFLRHGRPWWDIHRHRVAPQVGNQVAELIADGQLQVVAGRLVAVREAQDGVDVIFRRRGKAEAEPPRRFGYVFNCTGPLGDIGGTVDPLLRHLLDTRAIMADELAIGLSVDERSRAGPASNLWALGTLAKGRYWEIIAVPDIRDQAAQVADDIATELGR